MYSRILLKSAYFCQNCESITDCKNSCPGCGSSAILPLSCWLSRVAPALAHMALFLLAALMCVHTSRAQELLPAAPEPVPVVTKAHLAEWGGLVLARGADWASTQECQRRPAAWCHEYELPTSLVRNKAGFAGFEAAVAAGSAWFQLHEERRGHRKLAHWGQVGGDLVVGFTAGENWRVAAGSGTSTATFVAGGKPVRK